MVEAAPQRNMDVLNEVATPVRIGLIRDREAS
jgi:hypothetical protein